MKNAITVFKKEFYRVMSDKRLIFTAILLPGLAIFVMYSLMGNAIGNEIEDVNEHTMIIHIENMPNDLKTMISDDVLESDEDMKRTVTFVEATGITDTIKDGILIGDIDLYIEFPTDFESTLATYEDAGYEIPVINTFYNPGERYSESAYYFVSNYLSAYSNSISFDRHGDSLYVFHRDLDNPDHMIFNEEKAQGQGFAMLLPMLIIMFLFSGAMSIGPDSIAGEKERGTIATLLVTPIKRSELAIGKVLSLSVISLMSATSSFIGIMASLPKLMQMEGNGGLSADIYGIKEFVLIFSVLLATVLVIVGLVSMISAYAKNIKEASMLILPLYFVSIIVGISSMFSGEAASDAVMYLIPIFSSVNMLISILSFEFVALHFILMIVSSVVYVTVLIFIINKLFQSEKVMFSK
jgi:sodium transport system permease protein